LQLIKVFLLAQALTFSGFPIREMCWLATENDPVWLFS
jgi:hypothetical protein